MFGLVLMVIGILGYVGGVIYSLLSVDIDEIRVATIMSLMSMVAFMLGSILEVKDLQSPMSFRTTERKTKVKSYDDEQRKLNWYIGVIVFVIAMVLLVLFSIMFFEF